MDDINQVYKKNIVISGYYGFGNFGDDIILHVLIQNLFNVANNICVFSNNPNLTSKNFKVSSVHRFNIIKIFKKIINCDVLISGGGSLLQDATSFLSLVYYLFIIIIAKIFKKKVIIFAQGIGPINNLFGIFLTKNILKKCDFISVRDHKSYDLLKSWKIDSTLVSDPVFGLKLPLSTPMDRVGINIRDWKTLDEDFLFDLANNVNKYFSHKEVYIFSFQDAFDAKICQSFSNILFSINPKIKLKVLYNLTTNDIINEFRNLDYVISMRFHACLLGLKYKIRTLALSYDTKVEKLAKQFNIPFVKVENRENLEIGFKNLLNIDTFALGLKVNSVNFSFDSFNEFIKNV